MTKDSLTSDYRQMRAAEQPLDTAPRLVLASRSPRREQLLRQLGFNPQCKPADIPETAAPGESPQALVERLAIQKAQSCRAFYQADNHSGGRNDQDHCVIIGADTVIDFHGQIIGKPVERNDCLQTLQNLSDQTHKVHTGVCVLPAACTEALTVVVSSDVTFGPISATQAIAYWETGEPAGKAGGYAIQGIGAMFVAQVQGSFSNVMGLPLYETARLLSRAGLPVLGD
ncbi:MAG: Maf family protein [Granulosicoccus sp.]|nr:Maf family protein [Granulosicoccus sp.]